jgi:hypothetical protein
LSLPGANFFFDKQDLEVPVSGNKDELISRIAETLR